MGTGTTNVEGNTCTWAHEVDFKPGGKEDIGVMTFADETHLREDATDGAYHELWERVPGSEGASWGFRLTAEGKSDIICFGVLLSSLSVKLCRHEHALSYI